MKKLATLAVLLMAVPAFATGSYNGGGGDIADDGYDGTLGSMMASSVNVPAGEPGGDTVVNVVVDIDMAHTWVGDLTYKLQGPGGQVVTMMSRPVYEEAADDGGGCCGDSSDLVFGAPQTIGDGLGDIAENMGLVGGAVLPAGSWDPHGGVLGDMSLNGTFGGLSAVGNWTLYVGDSAGQDTGSVDNWTLRLETIPEPTTLSLLAIAGLAVVRRRR